jgi:hypothetical protein
VCRRFAVLAATFSAAAGLAAHAGGAAPGMTIGIFDEAHTLYGNPDYSFPLLKQLHVQVLRVNMYWGGRFGVAKSRPFDASDPADPAYDWTLYDRTVNYAYQYGMRVLFSIYGTPDWADGGAGPNHLPENVELLREFAQAAAIRYSGTYPDSDGRTLPPVRLWLAWNEPNNPVYLSPQFRRTGGKWVIQSAADYVRICSAIYAGIHSIGLSGEKVACGATSPRGNNQPASSRPSVSPLAFLRAVKADGLKRFDAWAHHPYYGSKSEQPTTKPPARGGALPTAVTLANIGDLVTELTQLYGPKVPIWVTEYGYQTNPPDRLFGVSYAAQAKYMREAFAIARKNPRITMMLWFMLQDEPLLSGWQSGMLTASGKKKPSFATFRSLPH